MKGIKFMPIKPIEISRITNNGLRVITKTEKEGSVSKTITQVTDNKNNILISRLKSTNPDSFLFKTQVTDYRIADHLALEIKKSFSRFIDHSDGTPYIKESIAVKNPGQNNFGKTITSDRYDKGNGYYA